MKIEYVKKCTSCKGTGIYTGFGECNGFGVVCHNCNGTGKIYVKIEYEEFIKRSSKKGIHTVLQTNPGIGVGIDEKQGLVKSSFGGMGYKEWKKTGKFPEGSEMRKFSCPAWWYQSVDYNKKPDWRTGDRQCQSFGSFSQCKNFATKEKCWEKWDKENK